MKYRAALASSLRITVAALIAFPPSVWGNPNLGQVIAGSAGISSSGSTLTVLQTSNNAIINWQGFSIAQGELTRFIQPSAASAVLNRVTGGNPSSIYGTLQANGKVFLINPNGVMVGPSGVINTQSFIASTLDVDNAQFMAGGALVFAGSSLAGIINAGRINALGGDILLIAHTVQNTGLLSAAGGTAAMAAGSEVLFEPSGTERVFVKAGAPDAAATGVDQKGQIEAATAELKAAGGNVYGLAINNSGIIRATGVSRVGGRVYLTAEGGTVVNSGQISAKQGDQGGSVQIVGGDITLKSGSSIDVSGPNGGGTALIGGDSQGLNPDVPNASKTTVEAGATINADATDNGNGGKVVVWSNDNTSFNGVISAKGGAAGGDAGSAEVSGGYLDYNGAVYLTAANGAMGTLLLDPLDLTIQTSGTQSVNTTGGGGNLTDTGTGNPSILLVSNLQTQLGSSNVTVQTGNGGAGNGGTITVANAVNWASGSTLKLSANNNIVVNSGANITNTGNGGVTMVANSAGANNGASITLNAGVTTAGGSQSYTSGTNGAINLNANITSTAGGQTYNGAVNLQANETLTTSGGNIAFNNTVNGAKSLTVNAGSGNIGFSGAVGNSAALTSLALGGTGTTSIGGNVTTAAGGSQVYNEKVALTNTAVLASNGGAVAFNNTVNGADDLTVNAGAGTVTLGAAVGNTTALNSLTVSGAGPILLNGGTIATNGAGAATGNQTYTGAVALGANTTLTSNTGNVAFGGAVNGADALTVNAGTAGNITFSGAVGNTTALTSLALTGTGTTTLGGGAVTTSGAQSYGEATTLGANTTMTTANAAVSFSNSVDGTVADAQSLTINAGTNNISLGSVGTTRRLSSLALNNTGTVGLNGTVNTNAAQTYAQAIVLNGNSGLSTNNNAITLNNTVNGATAGGQSLTLNSGSAATNINNTIGVGTRLGGLTVNGTGTTNLNAGTVDAGPQAYNAAVVLDKSTTLNSNGGTVDFNNNVNGLAADAQSLTVNAGAGNVSFNNAGSTTRLASLNVTGTGSLDLNGAINTNGAQSYTQAINLSGNSVLQTNNAAVTLGGAVNANTADTQSLTINAGSAAVGLANVGVTRRLSSFTLNNTGGLNLNGTINTNAAQTYNEAITLVGNSGLQTNNQAITLNSPIDGTTAGAQSLTLNAGTANTNINAAIGGTTRIGALTVNGTGTTSLNTPTLNTGAETFNQALNVVQNATLNSNGGTVSLNGAVNANTADAQSLTVNAGAGTINLGNVGVTREFSTLTLNGAAIGLNGTVKTNGAQTYSQAITLNGNSTLQTNNAGITLNGTVNGGNSLTLNGGSGNVSINGQIGNTSAIDALTISGTGTTNLNATAVKTNGTGDQTYGEAVVLGANTTLTTAGGNVVFSKTVDGAKTLTIDTTNGGGGGGFGGFGGGGDGNVTFGGSVGGGTALSSLLINTANVNGNQGSGNGGIININGGAVSTSGDQTYGDEIVMAANTTLNTAGGNLFFNDHVNGVTSGGQSLVINGANNVFFNRHVGGDQRLSSLIVNGTGTTDIDTGGVDTTGNQTYNENILLTNSPNLTTTGGNIVFNGTINGAQDLGVDVVTGNVTFNAAVGNTAALSSLDTTGTTGTTNLNGGSVKTTGLQSYGEKTVLGVDNTLSTTGGSVTFTQTVNGAHNLTINPAAGAVTFSGQVGNTTHLTSLAISGTGTTNLNGGVVNTDGLQTYGESAALGVDNTLSSNGGAVTFSKTVNGAHNLTVNAAAGNINVNGAVGNTTALTSLSLTGTGTTNLNGGSVRTTGAQNYGEKVSLGVDNALTTTSNGSVLFSGTVNGAHNLTASVGSGNITFNGAVGDVAHLLSLALTGTGTTNLNGGVVNTDGLQSYGEKVALGVDDVLSSNGGAVTFGNTVNGAQNLTVNAGAGNINVNGAVGDTAHLLSLALGGAGATSLNGGIVNTDGAQTYGENVALLGDNTLSSNGGAVTFSKTVNGAHNLTVNAAAGNINVNGAVGNTTALTSLSLTGTGTTNLNGGSVRTTGAQNYGEKVALGVDNALTTTSNGSVLFSGTVNGAHNLTASVGSGNITFNGAVGDVAHLLSLALTGTGTTNLNGGVVNTDGLQTYGEKVALGVDDVLSSNGGAVTFSNTVNGAQNLTVNAGSGNINVNGAVGNTTALTSLSLTGTGTTNLNGGSVRTTGAQNYGEKVSLGVDNALTTTSNGSVLFSGTVNGAHNLTASVGSGNITFNGAVGDVAHLLSLALTGTGTTNLNGGVVNTDGLQSYGEKVALGVDDVLSSNGGAVTFGNTVNGAQNLTVNAGAGNINVNGAVGDTAHLLSLALGGAGATSLNGGIVNTDGAQTYGENVALLGDNTLSSNGGAVALNGTVNGAHNLTVNAGAGNISVNGAVGNTAALSSLSLTGTGTTNLNGAAVNTNGTQNYGENVALLGDNTLGSNGGAVTFSGTVDGAKNLTVNAGAGNVNLNGAVGGNAGLVSLSVTGTGATNLNGGSVNTNGAQNYGENVVLGVDNALSSNGGAVTFGKTVNGANNLTVTAANVGLNGAVGGQTALTSLTSNGATSLNGGSVQTTGAQNYNGDTTLGVDNTLTGGAVNFNGKVNGPDNLTVTAANIGFNGAVGDQAALASLTTNGAASLNGGAINTNGAQTYNQSVTLGAATTLNSNGNAVTFNATVDGANDLIINAGAGNIYFYKMVGGLTPLASLLIADGLGTTDINGGGVYTNGAQTYGQNVILSADAYLSSHASDPAGTYLTGGDILFKGTVNGIASYVQNLTVDSGIGNITFMGDIGNIFPLLSLTLLGTGSKSILGTMNVGSLTTQGSLDYWNDLFLTSDLTLSVIDGNVTFHKRVNGLNGSFALNVTAQSLLANFGDIDFLGTVGDQTALASLTLKGSGTTHVNGGSVATTGNQSYGEALALGADTTLTSTLGGVSFLKAVNGVQGLTVNALNGLIDINGGAVNTVGDQIYNGAAALSAGAALTSSAGNIGFSSTLDGASYGLTTNSALDTTFGGAVNIGSLGATAGGKINLNNGLVTTAQDQTYNGTVALTPDATLTSQNGNIALNGAVNGANKLTTHSSLSTTFGGAVSVGSLDATASGINLNGASVQTGGAQSYNGDTTLGIDNTLTGSAVNFNGKVNGANNLTVNAANVGINGAIGSQAALTSLTSNGATSLNGGGVQTTGAQNYNGDTTLVVDNTLTGGAVNFNGKVNGANNLTVTAANVGLNGAVGGLTALTSLTSNGATSLKGGSVQTTGAQNYNGDTTLGVDNILTGGAVNFNGKVNGANNLTVTAANIGLNGAVGGQTALTSLTSNGATSLNGGSVQTTGAQNYNGDTTLVIDNALTGSAVNFNGKVDGANNLTVTAANVRLNGAVGGLTALTSLTSNGATSLKGGSVQTTGAQNYNGDTTLVVDNTLTGGAVNFNGKVNGANNLTVNAANIGFNGAVGDQAALASLTTNGAASLNGGAINTNGAQTYNQSVTLGAATTLNSNNSAVTFNGTVDGANALTINAGAGNIYFYKMVGGLTPLASLLIADGLGTTDINGGGVYTNGAQTYGQKVILSADAYLSSHASDPAGTYLTGGDILFKGTVNGIASYVQNLTVDSGIGNITFMGDIGNIFPLLSLTLLGTGSKSILGTMNVGSLTTQGSLDYWNDLFLTSDLTLSVIDGNVTFHKRVNGPFGLSVTAQSLQANFGDIDFLGTVGDVAPLASLTLKGSGTTHVNGGSVATTGNQSYGEALALGADTTLTSTLGGVSFLKAVNGAQGLTVNAQNGLIDINGGAVNTVGDQIYNGAAALSAGAALTSSAGNIGFSSTLDGTAYGLTTNSAQNTTFGGAVNVGSLGATANTVNLANGAVTTAQDQTYNGAVALTPDATLTSTNGNIAFNGAVTGANKLTTSSALDTTFGGAVNVGSLDATGSGKINLSNGAVTTAQDQTYNGAAALTPNAVLISQNGNIALNGSVTGVNSRLTTNSAQNTTFGGAVNVASLDATATGGKINLNTGTIGTSGDQSYNSAVVLTGDNSLTAGGAIGFAGAVDGVTKNLTTNSALVTTFDGAVNIGSLGATAQTIKLNNGVVTTAQDQAYNGAVALTPDASLTSGGNITLNGAVNGVSSNLKTTSALNTTFGGAVSVASLDATATGGKINLNTGTIGTSGDQSYNSAVVLTGDNRLTAGGAIGFAGAVDGVTKNLTTNSGSNTTFDGAVNVGSLDATASGKINLSNGAVTTAQDQTYNGAVALTPDAVLISQNGNIALNGAVTGANKLTTNSAQNTAFGGAVNVGSLDATASGKINLSDGAVTTAQDQTYNGAVALTPDAVLISQNGNIALNGAVSGANKLTTNSAQNTTFGGAVSVASLDATAGGNINLNAGSIATSGDQAYHAAVVIGADDSLVSSAGGVIFDKTIDGLQAGLQSLAIDAQNDFTLKDAVGAGTSLRSLALNAAGGAGSILLNGGQIDTTSGQTYGQGVVLGANTTLNNADALSAVTFDKTVGGKHALTINAGAGDINFLGGVGDAAGLTSLTSLALTGTGTTDINGGFIYTSGAQTYGEKVVLSANAWLGTDGNAGSDVTFDKTVNGTVIGQQGLTVDGGANGAITFYGAVGDQVPLSYLTLLGNGVHTLYGGVSTTGNQDYWNDLFLTGDLTLNSNGGNVTFHKRVNGAYNLTVNADFGDIGFLGLVGDLTPLSSLILTGTGLTTLSGGAVTTTGAQSYGEAVALGGNTALASNGGGISFGGSVNGAHSLTIAAGAGNIDFGGAVGDTAHLTSLFLSGNGVTSFNGGAVNTDGAQTYGEAVALGADTTLTSNGGSVTLNGGATGAHDLTVDASAANPLSAGGDIAWNALVSVVNLKLFGNDLLMRGDLSASGSNGALLVAGHSFQNLGSNAIQLPGTGRWLIYSIDPTLDARGGLTGSVQWSTTYRPGVPPAFSGNGFLYADAAPVIAPIIIPIGTINNGDNTGSGGQNNGGVYDGQVGDGGDEGSVSSNWSASPSDIFSWDLGTMRDAVASPDDDVDSYGRRKKKKAKAKTKSPWFKEP